MNKEVITVQINDVYELLSHFRISTEEIEEFQRTSRIVDFKLDDKLLLRISNRKLDELDRLQRVQGIGRVPKRYDHGEIRIKGVDYQYLIIDFIQGIELNTCIQSLTHEQSISIGKGIASFLLDLNSIKDSKYDIGHYIPTIPRYVGSWKEGHLIYLEYLEEELNKIKLSSAGKDTIIAAMNYIKQNASYLEHMNGPVILHNDLHPKNIIIKDGTFAGVIDWECSQFGEPEFELVHLFHWSIYPSIIGNNFDLLLKTVFEHFREHIDVPEIGKRLTIYQIEHELNQLIWNGENQEQERVMRIKGWLSGQIEAMILSWSH